MLKIAAAFGLGIALGALAYALAIRGTRPEENVSVTALERSVHELREEQSRSSADLAGRLEDLRRHLDEVTAFAHAARSSREVISAESPSATPNERPSASQDLEGPFAETNARMLRLESTLSATTSALEKRGQLAQYPSVEQLRRSRRDMDRDFIVQVTNALGREHDAGLAMVRYLTFEEVLAKVGTPTTINVEGNWFYERPEGQTLGPASFELDFVNGYVVQVHSTDE